MFFNAKSGRLELSGGKMEYIRFGRGEKVLVMLPGLGDGLRTVKGTALPMALMGGLCHRGDLFLPMLQNLLPQATGLHINLLPMTEGAILLARKENKSC